MATINDKKLIDKIIAGDGYYSDDTRVVKIVEYINNWGNATWGIIYKGMSLDYYAPSPFINNPKTIWEAKN